MAIKTLRVFAEYTSTGFVPMPTAGNIDYGYTLASTFPSSTPSSFQTDDPDLDVTVTAMTDFYVWIRINGTAWNPSYTRNVRVYPDSPDINNVVMNMIIATGPAGVSSYTQIVQTSNRLYFNGATTDSVYNSKFAGKTFINELTFGTAPQLATVATSGAYADLTGKPALSTVATSGSYADLSNKPSGTAPISYNSGTNSFQISVASASTNGYLTSTDWSTFNAKYLLPTGGTTAQYLRGDGTLATFPTTLDSTRLIFTGRNSTGSTLTKGTVVYINGVSGNTALLAKALATQDSTSAQTLGVVEFDIANNATGIVVLVGLVGNLDTSSYTEGVQLYLSGTTAGAFTSAKTLAPTHLVYVGIVTRAHPTQGTIEVKVQNGYELDEIHDVQISSPANKDILYHDTATSLWKHASIASVLGYTPYNATNPNNYIPLTALSASAPLSYNNTTGAFSITQANTSTNGFLSSTDWNTFNSKQNALTLGNVSEVSSNVLMFPDGGTGKTIGNLTIQVVQASASTNGYLSSTDWTTFNNKQGTVTLTTTGTSGAATFSAGTLNIPQYQTALTNPVTGTGTTNYIPKWTSSSAVGNSALQEVSGNLGLGVTPSAGGLSGYSLFEIANGGASIYSGLNQNLIGSNVSWSGSTPSYKASSFASLYNQQNGQHQWSTAPSGTAGTAITFATRMTLNTSGSLGIGISSPVFSDGFGVQIHNVSGSSRLRFTNNSSGATATDGGEIAFAGSDFYIGNNEAANLVLYTSAAERFRITSAGNVGIGTDSPTNKLTILNNGNTALAFTIKDTNANANFLSLSASNTDTAIIADGASGVPMDFYTGGNLRFRITASGNVGIGTSSPDIYGFGSSGKYLTLQSVSGGFSLIQVISDSTSGAGIVFGNTTLRRASIEGINGSNLVFSTNASNSGTSNTERMRISSAGFVGIGSNAPDTKLTVLDTAGAKISIGGGSTQNGMTWQGVNGAHSFYLFNGAFNSQGWGLYNINTAAFPLWVSNASNLSLGTTSDAGYRLYVNGAIYATGNIIANSDLTLKKNLKLVDNPIDKLNQLNGYLYQWKENHDYQYGVIAQEVENILPHAVTTGNNGIKGVAYNQLIPVMIEAIKELNRKLEAK
jgi:hypothetical protein